MAQAMRRNKKTLNLQQKIEILTKLDTGVQGKVLAEEYGVSKSTISYIKSQKKEIISAGTNKSQNLRKFFFRKPEYRKTICMFLDQRARNCPINGTIFKAKPKIFL